MIKKFLMNKLSLQKISEYSFLFLPIALITGPFLSDLIVSTSAIFFLIYSIKNKNYILGSQIKFYIEKFVNSTPIFDIHTHLFPSKFKKY